MSSAPETENGANVGADERELVCRPIGVVHSPFATRLAAPRQSARAKDTHGRIELYPGRGFEHALSDIEVWPYLWVLFWFHMNQGWRPKVLPPRSERKRGLFATRAPYRPNPIGLSVVKLERVEGLVLHVSALDMLDQTPVLDIKPYVPYADALPDAQGGWLETGLDPQPGFEVNIEPEAALALAYLEAAWGIVLTESITSTLALGPQQHAYRRIRKKGDRFVLAVKEWRARFRVEARSIFVEAIESGYRPRELATNDDPKLDPHRAFVRKSR